MFLHIRPIRMKVIWDTLRIYYLRIRSHMRIFYKKFPSIIHENMVLYSLVTHVEEIQDILFNYLSTYFTAHLAHISETDTECSLQYFARLYHFKCLQDPHICYTVFSSKQNSQSFVQVDDYGIDTGYSFRYTLGYYPVVTLHICLNSI
jgi:hypothetical protein